MCESKAKQNNKKFIQAEIKPQLPHAVMSSLLNKMANYFHQIGILHIHWLQHLPALVPGSEQQWLLLPCVALPCQNSWVIRSRQT